MVQCVFDLSLLYDSDLNELYFDIVYGLWHFEQYYHFLWIFECVLDLSVLYFMTVMWMSCIFDIVHSFIHVQKKAQNDK